MDTSRPETGSISDIQIVVFRLRDKAFGLDIREIREVAKVSDITAIRMPTGFVMGVSNLRGQIIAMVDLAKQFGFSSQDVLPQTARAVVVEHQGRTLGLIVDEVLEVVLVPQNQIDSSLNISPTDIREDYVQGSVTSENRHIRLIDLDKVVHDA